LTKKKPGITWQKSTFYLGATSELRRLMEAKGIDPDEQCTIEAGVRLLRKIRAEKGCLSR
jgi:hypothetical protein